MKLKHMFVAALASAALLLGAPVMAEEPGGVEAQLNAMVKQLSPEQQAALYLLLSQLTGGAATSEKPAEAADAAAPAAAASPEDIQAKAKAGVQAFVDAAKKGDVEAMMNFISDSFEHYQYGDKAGLKDFLTQAKDMGYLEGLEADMSETEIEEDGDELVLYPVEISGSFGTATFEYVLKKEGNDYKVVEFDATGI